MKCIICGNDIPLFSAQKIPNTTEKACETCSNHLRVLQYSAESNNPIYMEHYNYLKSKTSNGNLPKDICSYISTELARTLDIYNFHQSSNLSFDIDVDITTSYSFETKRIVEYCGIVSSESVLGTGIFSELSAQISDFKGSNASSIESKIEESKKSVIKKLYHQAAKKNCNGIIGFSFAVTILSGNMIVILGTGTAVKTE